MKNLIAGNGTNLYNVDQDFFKMCSKLCVHLLKFCLRICVQKSCVQLLKFVTLTKILSVLIMFFITLGSLTFLTLDPHLCPRVQISPGTEFFHVRKLSSLPRGCWWCLK